MNYDIPMPTAEEKNAAVKVILCEAMPPKENVFSLLRELSGVFGLRNLFFGIGDCVYLTVLLTFLLYTAVVAMAKQVLCSAVFTASPFLYLAAWLLVVWKEEKSGMLTLQGVCKYTPVHVSAIRMLCFGGMSLLVDIPVAAIAGVLQAGDFWKLLMLSFCALFLYAVLLLCLLLHCKARFAVSVLPVVWGSVCLLPLLKDYVQCETFLRNLPTYSLVLPVIVFAVLYFVLLNRYVRKEEEYADC